MSKFSERFNAILDPILIFLANNPWMPVSAILLFFFALGWNLAQVTK